MKSMLKTLVIFMIFFTGTISIVHVDRQCAQIYGSPSVITENLDNTAENIIEKYASLH